MVAQGKEIPLTTGLYATGRLMNYTETIMKSGKANIAHCNGAASFLARESENVEAQSLLSTSKFKRLFKDTYKLSS